MLRWLEQNWPYVFALVPVFTELAHGHFPHNVRCSISVIVAVVIIFFAIKFLLKQKIMVEKLSITDRLTGIYNSRHLRTELDRQVALAHRTHSALSIIFIDLDNFKNTNDNYGHHVGDNVLREFCQLLLQTIRKDVDLCFRFGGDEFVVLCQQTDIPEAHKVARRILYLSETFREFKEKQITMSMGVTQLKLKDKPSDFLKRVDKMMYIAKSEGKNRINCQ